MIMELLRSMSGLIDKFRLYLQHFENVIADTSKQIDKATLVGKRKSLADSNVLLHCGLFVDLLDLAKKFSLVSQKENFGIIELIEELDDMFLAYLMKRRFERPLLSVRFSKMDCCRRHGDNSWSNGCCAGEKHWKLIKDFWSLYTDV